MKRATLIVLFIVFFIPSIVSAQPVSVYDYSTGQHRTLDVQRQGNSTNIYDYQRGSYLDIPSSTQGARGIPDIFDHSPSSQSIPRRLEVYDYGAGQYRTFDIR